MLTQKRFTLIILVLALFLSTFVLYTPNPQTKSTEEFNVVYAMQTLAYISQDQHSVFDADNHEDVRLYLKDRLTDYLGASNVTEYTYDHTLVTDATIEYDIHNLLGVIPGNSETAIMLVGHYDSRGHVGRAGELGESYGAADDGYAIATMLEIARLYKDRNLENTIYILMTDAEETGLYGAAFATQETDLMSKVGFVINIEARGVKGPAYMFETSTNNNKVLDLYSNANYPVSYSLATAVYTVMPNSTDFTKFLAIDKNGMNFAVLDNLYYYHTPNDNYTNINPSSIQHYGEQIVSLVEEFATNATYSDINYFDGTHNDVFFTLFANVFVRYSESFANVMHILFLVALVAFIVLALRNESISLKRLGQSFGLFGGLMGAFIVVGYIVARIVAFYSKVDFSLTYVKTNLGGIPTLITLIGLTYLAYRVYVKKYQNMQTEFIVAGSLFNLLLALLTGFVLSGASFLFLVIGGLGTLFLFLNQYVKTFEVKQALFSVFMILAVLVIVPILYSLYLALTVGALLVLGLILSFYLIVLIPMFQAQYTLSK